MEFAVYAVDKDIFDIFAVQVGGRGGGGVILQFCATAFAVYAVNTDTCATFVMQVTGLCTPADRP